MVRFRLDCEFEMLDCVVTPTRPFLILRLQVLGWDLPESPFGLAYRPMARIRVRVCVAFHHRHGSNPSPGLDTPSRSSSLYS